MAAEKKNPAGKKDAPAKEGEENQKSLFHRLWDNPWFVVVVAAMLLWVGRHFDDSPLRAERQLLVATASVRGDIFDNAVIFVLTHRRSGATGVMLNKPEKDAGPHDYDGGPMEKDKLIALQSLDVTFPDTVEMQGPGLGALIGNKAVKELQDAEKKPAWYRIYHGYTGWGRYQLENELHAGEWQLVEFDRDTVEKTPAEKLWDQVHTLPVLQGH
ncbi:MAG: hypothetical protein GC185_00440 [Alphaproteobacteria bacterium]|nr:hypothetical protein [Alphaproteobacteria bacterium]